MLEEHSPSGASGGRVSCTVQRPVQLCCGWYAPALYVVTHAVDVAGRHHGDSITSKRSTATAWLHDIALAGETDTTATTTTWRRSRTVR